MLFRSLDAIKEAATLVANGKIIAVKGIGGFHLCCNGSDEEAVCRLRNLKNRPMKPWAVMMKDLDRVKKECIIKKGQEDILTGHQKPILILDKREDGDLCQGISPDNDAVGVMLPYAPVHEILFEFVSVISLALLLPIFTQKKATTASGLFLHPNGLFCVYYLGVYMCSGL